MPWEKDKAHRSMLQGQAGVYAVASQLILRDHTPMFPAVDVGADIILSNGLRIQVKSARLTSGKYHGNGGNYKSGAYGFCVRRGEYRNNRWTAKSKTGYAGVADFFVLWGINENRFWIVPTSITNRTIWFGRRDEQNVSNNFSYTNKLKEDRIAQYENRWDLLDMNAAVETLIEGAAEAVAPREI